ncbi:MAG: helix-turn-helix domain-containing protein [Microbacterium sp.]
MLRFQDDIGKVHMHGRDTGDTLTARGEKAQTRILEAAAEVFAQTGYNGSTLDRIARRAGLTRAGVLHHFPSKLDILQAVLSERDDRNIAAVGRVTDSLRVFDTVVDVAVRDTEDVTLTRAFAVLLGEAAALDSPTSAWFRTHHRELTREISAAVAAAIAEGTARADASPDDVAAEVIAVMDGLQSQWMIGGDAQTYLRLLGDYLARLRGYLLRAE